MTQVGLRGPYQESSYALCVQGGMYSPTDSETDYIGQLPRVPIITAAISKVYIRSLGTIKRAELYVYASGVAGSNENWSFYIRLNNTTDYLIQTVALNTAQRIVTNAAMAVPLVAGDYFEIKIVNPAWATNPTNVYIGGYIYVE